MAVDLTAVLAYAQGKTDGISHQGMAIPTTRLEEEGFRANSALSKAIALVLASKNPRDMLSGAALDLKKALSWDNNKEFHHIFPRAFLREKGLAPEKINVVPNIAILSSASNKAISQSSPAQYLKISRDALGAEFEAVMASNFIVGEALAAAEKNDYDTFVKARGMSIQRAAWDLAGWP